MSDKVLFWLSIIFFTGSVVLLTGVLVEGYYLRELDVTAVVLNCIYGLIGLYFIHETAKDVGR
ncbi:hypothetical protein [Alkalicoccobacillus gibsonii]|uniref:hypothetical protein n=1 Tax=Alkalicoccobacillus gibsonii TaxID=79881 RepID=UPI0035190CF9